MPNLPDSFRTYSDHCVHMFIKSDRGDVRRNNDESYGSRAYYFTTWCESHHITQHHLLRITQPEVLRVLGTYLHDLKLGRNLKNLHLAGQTLRNYMNAALTFIETIQQTYISIADPHSSSGIPKLHPYLRDLIQQRIIWREPEKRYEPYTARMFEVMQQTLLASTAKTAFLSKEWCVYDTQRLGVFTGSRVTEYAQTGLKRRQPYLRIPYTKDAGDWKGMPLAFISDDFAFYTPEGCKLPNTMQLLEHHQQLSLTLEIRFRYDKSKRNFHFRKYARTHHPIFDPVDAAVSIITRALSLGIPTSEPVCAFQIAKSKFRFLNDNAIIKTMKSVVIATYPNPAHFMRLHIDRVVTHSNRVTAAVCLKQGKATDEEIAYRLRWHITSVPTYLRDCFQAVGTLMQQTIHGALMTSG